MRLLPALVRIPCCFAALLLAGSWPGCGAGSSLDEYEDGVPDVVPAPIRSTPDGGAAGEIGAACQETDDCEQSGAECLTNVSLGLASINFPGGYCSQSCQGGAACPRDSACLPLANTCLRTCQSNADCREEEGYQCAALAGATRFCAPASAATLGGLIGGAGGTTGGFIAGLFGGNAGGGTPGGAGGTTGGFIAGLFGGNTGGGMPGGAGGSGGFLAGLFGGTQEGSSAVGAPP